MSPFPGNHETGTTARPLAPEADLATVLHLAQEALRIGTMIDPEELLCQLLSLDPAQLQDWLDQDTVDTYRATHKPEDQLLPNTYPFNGTHGPRWIDQQGDTWTLGDDGLLHTPDTAPFPHDHVEKKWGPLTPARSLPASRARVRDPGRWRVAEAGTVAHSTEHAGALCGAQDAGPWRTVAGVSQCPACVELEEVLDRHG